MGPSVQWRPGGQQLAGDLELLRFEIADINVVIKKACADSLLYGDQVVTSADLDTGVGILPLSCFAVTAQWPAERLAAGTNYRRCRRVRASVLLDAGYLPAAHRGLPGRLAGPAQRRPLRSRGPGRRRPSAAGHVGQQGGARRGARRAPARVRASAPVARPCGRPGRVGGTAEQVLVATMGSEQASW